MNDDAPSTPSDNPGDAGSNPPPPPQDGTPDGAAVPPPFDPNKTVMRPRGPESSADEPGAVPPPGAFPSDPAAPDPAAAPADGPAGGPAPADSGAPAWAADPAPATQQVLIDDTATSGDGGPIDPDFPTKASKAGSAGAIVAVGTGLLAAAIVISGVRSRDDGDLDWSNYGIGLGAAALLLLIAVTGALSARRAGGRAREEVVTWPGVTGILGTALMIGIGIDKDDPWVVYLIGIVIIALSAIGYVAARRAAFTITGLLGLALVYGQAFDDLLADSIDEDNGFVVGAAVVGVFVLAVTLLGWLLPSRAVTGVVVGAAGVVTYVGIMTALIAFRYLSEFFGPMMFGAEDDLDGLGADPAGDLGGFKESDVWWILAFAAVLTLLWALAAAISNHPGFSILAIVMPALMVPLASVALAAEHPSRWSAVVAAAGGVLLLGGVVLARLRGKSVAQELPVGATR